MVFWNIWWQLIIFNDKTISIIITNSQTCDCHRPIQKGMIISKLPKLDDSTSKVVMPIRVWLLFTSCVSGRGNRIGHICLSVCLSVCLSGCLSVCLAVCLGLWDRCLAPPSEYRTTLCTIDLCCAPPTCVVHHGAQGGPIVFLCLTTNMQIKVHNVVKYWRRPW